MTSFENTAKFMKTFRETTNMSQRELCANFAPGMNSQFVSNWERGLCAPPAHFVKKLTKQKKINFDKIGYIKAYSQDGYESAQLTIEIDLK